MCTGLPAYFSGCRHPLNNVGYICSDLILSPLRSHFRSFWLSEKSQKHLILYTNKQTLWRCLNLHMLNEHKTHSDSKLSITRITSPNQSMFQSDAVYCSAVSHALPILTYLTFTERVCSAFCLKRWQTLTAACTVYHSLTSNLTYHQPVCILALKACVHPMTASTVPASHQKLAFIQCLLFQQLPLPVDWLKSRCDFSVDYSDNERLRY